MFPAPISDNPGKVRAYRLALAGSLALWLLPIFAVAFTSIRPLEDINRGNIWGWPSKLSLVENYTEVLTGSAMHHFILNSILITVPAVAGTLALSVMSAYVLAKHRFPGRTLLLGLFIAGNLAPSQVLMIPVRHLIVDVFGIYDTHFALILFHTAFQTGFCTLLLHIFVRQVPQALIDAARLDGVGELRIFWAVVVPLVRPAMAAAAVLIFTFVWNDYFWSLVLVQSDDVRPVTAGLQSLRGMWIASWHLISAGAVIAAIPPVLVFFFMQRHFIAGLTSGALAE
jgi:multiple sugar transport system permease protein